MKEEKIKMDQDKASAFDKNNYFEISANVVERRNSTDKQQGLDGASSKSPAKNRNKDNKIKGQGSNGSELFSPDSSERRIDALLAKAKESLDKKIIDQKELQLKQKNTMPPHRRDKKRDKNKKGEANSKSRPSSQDDPKTRPSSPKTTGADQSKNKTPSEIASKEEPLILMNEVRAKLKPMESGSKTRPPSPETVIAKDKTIKQRRRSVPNIAIAWGVGETGSSNEKIDGKNGIVRQNSLDSMKVKQLEKRQAAASGSFGSASSLEQSMTRSLGSRGSLCDENYDECDNINVVVRCRPLNDKEKRNKDELNLTFPGEGQAWVNMDGMNGQGQQKPKIFSYNVVFEPEALQEDILEHSGVKRLLDMSIDGFSCTVFCYGQTGSGKTHTLTGPPHLFENGTHMFSEDHGLIFRSFVYLFNQLETREEQEFTLTASYLEIYNEKVIDLLNLGTNQKPLQIRWSKKKRGFFVENLFEIECAELDDLLAVLEEGLRNRAVASHNMNEYSSRSHTILSVNITSEQKAEDGVYITRNGKINFVDLAGSEMTKKTNSEGKTLEEANNINKSLMVLGTCIAALSDSRKRDGHVPYRDSKLTKLLADSLAGNGVTLMIACISPAKSNISETINTLRYAARAKRIRTKPIIVMDPKEKVILSLQQEVSLLREENAHLKMLLDIADVDGEGLPPGGMANGAGNHAVNGIDYAEKVNGSGTAAPPSMPSRQGSFRVDKDKLAGLDNGELINLVQHYMTQHESVRKENKELQSVTTALARDQDLVCKENERLLRKLEDVSRGSDSDSKTDNGDGSRSLPSSSSNSQVWINPLNDNSRGKDGLTSSGSAPGSSSSNQRPHRLPESINKELEKRRIGKSLNDLSGSGGSGGDRHSGGRRNSWDNTQEGNSLPPMRRPNMKNKSMSPGMGGKSGIRAKARSQSVPRPRGRGRGSGGAGRANVVGDPPDRRPQGMRTS